MNITPLILVITILTITLCTQLPVISPCTDHTESTRGSPRCETEKSDEEEQLLSCDGEQVASHGQDGQPRSPRDDAVDHLPAEVDHSNCENADKAEEIEAARKDVEKLQQYLSTSESRNAELQRQCETLLRDLEGARPFLNTADTFADSEVIQVLQKLNAELQHTAAIMADRVVTTFRLDATISDPEQQVMNRASESIGPTLVEFLRTAGRDDSESPVYLQIAFQAHLSKHLCWIASSWTLNEGRNTFITEIYQRLRDTERQAISGRWRSLTRVHSLPTCVSEPNSFVIPVIAGLSDILLVAGCAASRSHIMSELSSMFGDKILSAVSLAGSLNQMIGGVISGDFEVFVVRCGEMFRREVMDDMDDSGETQDGTETAQTVLCTSEMGLTKRVQLETGTRETRTVIKAKVIFESFLDAEDLS